MGIFHSYLSLPEGRPGRPYHKHKFFKIFIHTHTPNGKVSTPDLSNPQGCFLKTGGSYFEVAKRIPFPGRTEPNESPAGLQHDQIPLGLVLDGASHVVAIYV